MSEEDQNEMQDEIENNPWAPGTVITEMHPLHAMTEAWRVAEEFFVEIGFPQHIADKNAKALFARLAGLNPPVLPCHPHEMKE